VQKRQPEAHELESPHFHHEQKKCDIARFGIKLRVPLNEEPNLLSDLVEEVLETKNKPPNKLKCRTHNVMAWGCGWEIGKHI